MLACHVAAATEADWIRRAGVTVAIFGAIVAAPSGSLLIVLGFWAGILKVQERLPRWLLGGKPSPAVVQARAGLAAAFGVAAGAKVVRNENARGRVQIRQLWKEVDRLDERIGKAEAESRERHAVLAARLAHESAARRAALKAQEAQRRREEQQAARIDARGLPLIGLGVLMTGIPDGLARWPWLGWALIVLAGILVIWLALWPFGAHVIQRNQPTPAESTDASPS